MPEYSGAQHANKNTQTTQPSQSIAKTASRPEVQEKQNLQRAVILPQFACQQEIMGLQGVAGNQAVNAMIQTKLSVGPAVDRYEQEADRVADQVMGRSNPDRAPAISSLNGLARPEKMPKQQDRARQHTASAEMEEHLKDRQGQGQALPDTARRLMESRFDADLSQVRIHTGQAAEQFNQDLNADAFTYGRDIYMAAGRYEPHSDSGQRLLAHEITHVVQQGGADAAQAAPQAVQRQWRKGEKPKGPAESGGPMIGRRAAAGPRLEPRAQSEASYMSWLQSHPGMLSDKERQALGIAAPRPMQTSEGGLQALAARQQDQRRRELGALSPSVGPRGEHSHDEAGDAASITEDPRFKARYQVDRESDHGNWLTRKLKRGKEVAADKLHEAQSYLPGQHSVVPGEDYEQQFETRGQTAKRIARTAAAKAGPAALGALPLMGTGMKIAGAVKEHKRQKEAEQIEEIAGMSGTPDSMSTPMLSSMSHGLAEEHFENKVVKGVEAAASGVSDAVTITGAVLSGGASLGATEAANEVFKQSVKPIVSAGVKGVKIGAKLGQAIVGATRDDREYRLQAAGAGSDREHGAALGSLAAEDPDFSHAMLDHLAPGQMSVGRELYTNAMVQKPKGDHTLKPSGVARLGRQESARLRERERMGADRTWSLHGEQAAEEARKAAAKQKTPPAPASGIPAPPPLPSAPRTTGPMGENLLGQLLRSEKKTWYD